MSVLFADLVDSTGLVAELGAEGFRRLQQTYFPRVRECIEGHGGVVEKYVGDAVMAVFGLLGEERHADQAAGAALDILEIIEGLSEGENDLPALAARVGIDTGLVSIGDPTVGQLIAAGDLVIQAARLQESAPRNHVVMSQATKDALTGGYSIESIDMTHSTFIVHRKDTRLARPRSGIPLVDRRDELTYLSELAGEAFGSRSLRCAVVHGPAGVGKTRLVQELCRALAEVPALWGRCIPYGSGSLGWFPHTEMLQDVVPAHPNESAADVSGRIEHLRTAAGGGFATDSLLRLSGHTDDPPDLEEGASTFSQTIRSWSRRRPVILVFQDCQWARREVIHTIRNLREDHADLPLLVVCISREPSISDRIGLMPSELTELRPLETSAVTELAAEMIPDGDPDSVEYLAAVSGGFPLTLEESVWLRSQTTRWAEILGELARGQEPISPQELIDNRLAFCADHRHVLEMAAVRGKIFWRGDLIESNSPGEVSECNRALAALVEAGLLRYAFEQGDDWFSFRHQLVVEQTYKSVDEARLRKLHERCGKWLMRSLSDHWFYRSLAQYHLDRASGLEDPPRYVAGDCRRESTRSSSVRPGRR